ncbi:hypothetical protein ACQKM2_38210 [Streptomyces sp. NPDC004126]|uniref:hypothetical protein n=1 Tax=Streptomyces sp. NPDC004126 TaxID=3390695 RepID=UPI003D050DBD
MTLDDLYTRIVIEELGALETNDVARLPLLTSLEADLVLAILTAVVDGDTGENVQTVARGLGARLRMRLPAPARTAAGIVARLTADRDRNSGRGGGPSA